MSTSRHLAEFRASDVLSGLHGFQRDAVDHAFERLFMAADSSRRFLVADEVGLGKTMIARGVLAKAIEHLRDKVDRIDVVYICSNMSIARQNINRLNPLQDREFADAQRITLLPLHMRDVQPGHLNLLAFTPGTSLELTQSMGVRQERLLLYALLEQIWSISGVGALNVLQGDVKNTEWFRAEARALRRELGPDLSASSALATALSEELARDASIRERFSTLCEQFKRTRQNVPEEERRERNSVVGALRSALARVCISSLEPDLIILDEFQRFKDLLEPDSEAGELARQLFDWSKGSARARVLLLSATPYKPYTPQHEIHEENHYRDFVRTLRFLFNEPDAAVGVEDAMRQFRRELLRGAELSVDQLRKLKGEIETTLRRVMSRTERLIAAGQHNGMLRSVIHDNLLVDADDLQAYVGMRRLTDAIDVDDPIEYWKSAPYAINFMEGYRLSAVLREHVESDLMSAELHGSGAGITEHVLPTANLSVHAPVAFPNSKFRSLVSDLDSMGAFELLWLPPALPVYDCSDAFRRATERGITKRLVFSAWNVVPRSIASLLSYEAERRGVLSDPVVGKGDDVGGVERGSLLRLSVSEGRPAGMPALALMYPARTLARLCDPREFGRERGGRTASLAETIDWAKERIRAALPADIEWSQEGKIGDEAWYWAMPILLDYMDDPTRSTAWWWQPELAAKWSGQMTDRAEGESDTADAGWVEHVEEAASVGSGARRPTGAVPADVLDLLALLGVAAPGLCALRALWRLFPEEARATESCADITAAQLGWSFRRLLNRPQSTAVIRRGDRSKPYWRLALEYCAGGCLSSVLEEYVHVLRDSTGSSTLPVDRVCEEVSQAMAEALGIRAATLRIDDVRVDRETNLIQLGDLRMRTLFAMRFGSDRTEDDKQAVRDSAVRGAFNSPFWPFVLATTSVGQEGLDFHWYCHAVVHWNLPSNPVDLEQREGRVHRFKGHAIRKNVAAKHAAAALCSPGADVWSSAFSLATADRSADDRGLVPYWLYPLEDGAWIERHVPLYALSRDEIRYRSLQKELGAYRLVFGQPRQDELLAYLMNRVDARQLQSLVELLRVDLAPPRCADP